MKPSKCLIAVFISVLVMILPVGLQAEAAKAKSADGLSISYRVQGKGDVALVFVHCWCCDKSFWKSQVPIFSKHFRVVTLDLGGHGESGTNRKNWTIQAFANDVASVVKKLNLKKIILIGHSMGGPVTVETARLFPDRVLGIVAVDTLLNVEQKFTQEQFEQFVAPMRKDFKGATANFIRGFMFTPESDPAVVDRIVNKMSSAEPEIALGAWENMFTYDLAGAMDRIKIPIRLIIADKFPYNLEAGRRHAVSFEVKVMKGVGHFLHMEKPEAFNKLLFETLKEISE